MKRIKRFVIFIVLVGVLISAGSIGIVTVGNLPDRFVLDISSLQPSVNEGEAETVSLVRVVDGDTLVVTHENGSESTVRLIGIDAPESVHDDPEKNTEEGLVASDYLKGILAEGQLLYLVKDVSNTDKYDRLLRYVWLEQPTPELDLATSMLNAKLVADGYAQAKDFPPDSRFKEEFAELGDEAKKAGRGVSYMWAGAYHE